MYFMRGCVIAQIRWEVWLRFFFQKQCIGITQLIWNFELNPSKGSGVIEIPRNFTFWGGGRGRVLGKKKMSLVLVFFLISAHLVLFSSVIWKIIIFSSMQGIFGNPVLSEIIIKKIWLYCKKGRKFYFLPYE